MSWRSHMLFQRRSSWCHCQPINASLPLAHQAHLFPPPHISLNFRSLHWKLQ
jgi:hypothetical protein